MTLTQLESKGVQFFRINNLLHVLSDELPAKGDTILDTRDCTWGVHDGKYGNYIAFKCTKPDEITVVEGMDPKYIKKLVLHTI